MNCWEFALFATYKAGRLSYQDLVDMHNRAAEAGKANGFGAYYDALGKAMGMDQAVTCWG